MQMQKKFKDESNKPQSACECWIGELDQHASQHLKNRKSGMAASTSHLIVSFKNVIGEISQEQIVYTLQIHQDQNQTVMSTCRFTSFCLRRHIQSLQGTLNAFQWNGRYLTLQAVILDKTDIKGRGPVLSPFKEKPHSLAWTSLQVVC